MNKELEPIAKQVSLLNRLLELLRMQDDFEVIKGEDLGKWAWAAGIEVNYTISGSYILDIYLAKEPAAELTIEEAWNHPITQKAWSDELVKVARELIGTQSKFDTNYFKDSEAMMCICMDSVERLIHYTLKAIWINDKGEFIYCLEAILNKYKRSLCE